MILPGFGAQCGGGVVVEACLNGRTGQYVTICDVSGSSVADSRTRAFFRPAGALSSDQSGRNESSLS